MAKGQSNKKNAKQSARASPKTRKPVVQSDKIVSDYVALLRDPCNGPLVGPVGASSNGYITRFEKTVTVNPAFQNFWLVWAPGNLDHVSLGTNITGIAGYDQASASSTTKTGVLTNINAPGYAFLSSTASSFRTLAACAQITYTGAELNRSGVIGSGIVNGSRSSDDPFVSTDEALSNCVSRDRLQSEVQEVLWQPGEGDIQFAPFSSNGAPERGERVPRNGMLIAGKGVVTGTISVRFVVIYQWLPGANDNIVIPVPTPKTHMTLAHVLMLAKRNGFNAGHLLRMGQRYLPAMASRVAPMLLSM